MQLVLVGHSKSQGAGAVSAGRKHSTSQGAGAVSAGCKHSKSQGAGAVSVQLVLVVNTQARRDAPPHA